MLGAEDKRKALMVGDRRHDIIGAHKNGIRACGVTFGYSEPGELESCGADRIADSVETPAGRADRFLPNNGAVICASRTICKRLQL